MESAHETESFHLQHIEAAAGVVDLNMKGYRRGLTSRTFSDYLTVVTHFFILTYVVLIVYLCFSHEFIFFTWHPLLLSVGWMMLMTEAILAFSRDNSFTNKLSYFMKARYHWILQSVAAILIIVGFSIVFINKIRLGKTHFKSWHAFLGLISFICMIPSCLNGVATLYNIDLKQYIRPKTLKFIHLVSGITTFIFGGMTLTLSVYTKWFERNTNGNEVVFYYALLAVLISVSWTLVQPLIACYTKIKQLLNID